jgi:sugar lactone lactonase YvrE
MKKNRMMIAAAFSAMVAMAVETKTWVQTEASEFEKGKLTKLALSNKGKVSLAPMSRDLFDPSVTQLWCAVIDKQGNAYAGGAEGKVVHVDSKGKGRILATLEGGGVYALATNAKGELFAAVMPDAKIYRVAPDGKTQIFSALKAKYVWAMAFDGAGTMYAATGEPGQVQKVAPDGKATVLFDAKEAHVRSMALDGAGNIIVGTEPGGTVVRVSPAGEGFILHQTAKREVTSLAVGKDGAIYAASTGTRGAPARPMPEQPAPQPQPTPAQGQTGAQVRPSPQPQPSVILPMSAAAGGSDIDLIAPDGEPRRMWSSPQAVVYALALDGAGRLLAGTGNDGRLYRIESERESTQLLEAGPTQITALSTLPNGGLILATANAGKVVQVGPELEKEGILESEVFDAGAFTYWGRLRQESELNGGSLAIETRSGNVDSAEKNWSAWAVPDAAKGGRIVSPPARFLGWRAVLKPSADGKSPSLSLVEAAYQQKNAAPVIEAVEVTAPNYKFPAPGSSLTASTTLSLGPIGQPKRSSPSTPATDGGSAASLNFDKGWRAARWKANDRNGDSLQYRAEYRGAGEQEWKLLKDELKEARLSWDTTSYPDGKYRLRITATDQGDNYPGQGLTQTLESDEFTIDNTPPRIEALSGKIEGGKLVVQFQAKDDATHLYLAEYSINGGEWTPIMPTTRLTDSLEHEYRAELAKPASQEIVVAVKVTDDSDNVAVQKILLRP